MASWFSGALLVTPNNHITCQSFLQVLGKVKEKILEKPKHPYLPEQVAVYCLLLRTNTCLRYGIETSLKFLCVSFTEKRNLGRPFDIINYTPTSQSCLDKLDITSWRSGREKRSQCFNIRLGIFETRTNQHVDHRGFCQLSVLMPEFTRMLIGNLALQGPWQILPGACEPPSFSLRNCSPGFHQGWCLSSSRHCQALSSIKSRWNQHHYLGQGPCCQSVDWESQKLNRCYGQCLEKPWNFGWMKEKCWTSGMVAGWCLSVPDSILCLTGSY